MGKEGLLKFTKSDKKSEKQEEEKTLTPEEERDLKAKQMANTLLQEVRLPKIGEQANDDLLEVDDRPNTMSTDWLTEQMTLLTEENERLRKEAEVAKEDYAKIFREYQQMKTNAGIVDENALKIKVVEYFDELQNYFISKGYNLNSGNGNLIVKFPAFLEKIVSFFPFLANKRKYRV
ncbi:MAG: hypothetical protein WC333_00595 [Dehalococcoidia bacterium]|jgi:vacuolar-type H+-ATPase subunit I/STV1